MRQGSRSASNVLREFRPRLIEGRKPNKEGRKEATKEKNTLEEDTGREGEEDQEKKKTLSRCVPAGERSAKEKQNLKFWQQRYQQGSRLSPC